MYDPSQALLNTLYSDDVVKPTKASRDPNIIQQQDYLEASFAANVPSFPIQDPFLNAAQYTGTIYLAIQHLMQAMSGVSAILEKKVDGKKGTVASSGALNTDQGYEPFTDHELNNILQKPNPADTFVDFVCQCVLNWNLHGRILIWARPNKVGAPMRYYCLPIPLCQPAFSVGSQDYPLGAWRIQQYYPTTGITGILPNGLVGSLGSIIDAREVYEMKNPHPVYRWAPFSSLVGGNAAVDNIHMIDLSFWSCMSAGPKPAGFIDAPGADADQILAIQRKIDNAAGGARKHGRPIVLGGGDPDRPALAWNPVGSLVPDALHEGGWEIYTSFVLALFGLDMASVGLRRTGGHAERWAARRDERDTLMGFLSRLAAVLTSGGLVKNWGLLKRGVRVAINLPELVGYDPAEMSRDMAGDGSGTWNEIRRLRGFKGIAGDMEEFGELPLPLAIKMAEKKLGIDQVSTEKELGDMDAKRQEQQAQQDHGRALEATSEEAKNNPDNNREDTPNDAKGSLGGAGAGAPKVTIKGIAEWKNRLPLPADQRFNYSSLLPLEPGTIDITDTLPSQEDTLQSVVSRVLSSPILCNGDGKV